MLRIGTIAFDQLKTMMASQSGTYTIPQGPRSDHREIVVAGAHIVWLGVDKT